MSSIYDKFNLEVSFMIIHAKAASLTAKVDCLYPESFAIGTLLISQNEITNLLLKQNVNLDKCLKELKEQLAKRSEQKKSETEDDSNNHFDSFSLSKKVVQICEEANELSLKQFRSDSINIVHMFLALLQVCPEIKQIFINSGANIETLIEDIRTKKNKQNPRKTGTKDSALASFCVNMTEMAINNKFDPIIAREREIEEAITILCRRNKSNPILVGDPGVGKTAVVEGICQRIVSKTVPKKLHNCSIYALKMGTLIAGTKYRGEFEARVDSLLKELKENENIILFIDEIHTIVGAGAASGSVDASNLLKPELARGMKCIGATTQAEYKKFFKEDGALDRRFENITIDEPDVEQTIRIVKGVKSRYEEFHECIITDDAVTMAVDLTKRFVHSKRFPDKALDCIDTACASFSWENEDAKRIITGDDIALVVSKQTQIPLEMILVDNYKRIMNIEINLKNRVIGQAHVINAFCTSMKNAYSGVRDPNKPIGTFVFGGETGTGKTYMAKEIAASLFGKTESFIRLDMTEYTEKHSISKLIGSPPGYVGFKEADTIADRIRKKPYCVILLDEFDKGHPDVVKLFLQVMQDGFFTDAQQQEVDCRNSILIMTGNFGMNEKSGGKLGFADNKALSNLEQEKTRLIKYCEERFGIEFGNKTDEFLVFMPINNEDLKAITALRLDDFIKRVDKKDVVFHFAEDMINKIIVKSVLEHGRNANMINRVIKKYIEPVVGDAIMKAQLDKESSHKITITTNKDGEFVSRVRKTKIKQSC